MERKIIAFFKRILVCICCSALCVNAVMANETCFKDTIPTLGLPLEQVEFSDIDASQVSPIKNDQLKGKWCMLYLWNKYCSSCIASFQLLNSWNEQFSDNLKILLVGYTGSQYTQRPDFDSIKKLYQLEREKHKLNLAIAYDSLLFHKYNIYSSPYIILLDPDGVVRGITASITSEDLRSFIDGKTPALPKVWRKGENKYQYNSSAPLFIDNNGGSQFEYEYRSVLTRWQDHMPSDLRFSISDTLFQVARVDLSTLYKFAYLGLTMYNFGKPEYYIYSPFPILRLKDSSDFRPNFRLGLNLFCYTLAGKDLLERKERIRHSLQEALAINFGFKVNIIKKHVPCLWLIDLPKEVRDTNWNESKIIRYISTEDLLRDIYTYNSEQNLIVVDKTKSKSKHSFVGIECDMTNIDDVNLWLKKSALKLVKGEQEMKVLEISQ